VLCFGSADSKGVSGGTLDRVSGDFGALGCTPGDLQESAEVIGWKGVGGTLLLEECTRIRKQSIYILALLAKE